MLQIWWDELKLSSVSFSVAAAHLSYHPKFEGFARCLIGNSPSKCMVYLIFNKCTRLSQVAKPAKNTFNSLMFLYTEVFSKRRKTCALCREPPSKYSSLPESSQDCCCPSRHPHGRINLAYRATPNTILTLSQALCNQFVEKLRPCC